MTSAEPGGTSAFADTDPDARPPDESMDEEAPSRGEILRALKYVERKVDSHQREIYGEGRDLGLRGVISRLDGTVRDLDEDLGAQRKELMEAFSKFSLDTDEKIENAVESLSQKIDERRLPMWASWILFFCAVVVAGAVGYNAFHGQ